MKGCFVITDFRFPSFLKPKPPDPYAEKKILKAQEGQQSGIGETKVTVSGPSAQFSSVQLLSHV